MAASNRERVGKILDLLNQGLIPFVERELRSVYGDQWEGTTAGIISEGKDGELHWDTSGLLKLIWDQWHDVFKQQLGHTQRSYVSELRDTRNRWAHQEPFSLDDALRAGDTATRLLRDISAPEADEVYREVLGLQRVRYDEQAKRERRKAAKTSTEGQPQGGLLPWREVITPHPDVASGKYQLAEFAADLSKVHRGEATAEYQNPRDFYERTYITDGLRRLLVGAIRRLAAADGDPIIQLQTNFGGGKTHSLLALYHLASGIAAADLPGLDELVKEAGAEVPEKVNRAVLVGSALSPAETRDKPDGVVTHTLWGEMAWQLLGEKGYAFVAEADQHGVSPGSERLTRLFEAAAPCMILIDEWIVHVRQLLGKDGLPGGNFDAAFSFAQSLTEAVRGTSGALLVVSVPASDNEIGGEAGRIALERMTNVLARMDSPWRPASAEEGFEIVRRRLFEPLIDPEKVRARDAVAKAFREYYAASATEFPSECREGAYEERIKAAYPIHPELFDRLYNDWSSLDRFQRTRGVLRLMARVIHALWRRDDRNLLILPATIPVADQFVRDQLTTYLEDNWVPIIDQDVDGPHSLPLRLDDENPTIGRYSATRRVARTIYLGSAPTKGLPNRGIDDKQMKLGCAQPGETVATFGDALRRLLDQATYVFSDQGRYWYDTHQNVSQTARGRAGQYNDDSVYEEIRRWVRKEQSQRGDFARVHAFPGTSAEVPDERETRLVILDPQAPYDPRVEETAAIQRATEILNRRGETPRSYRNGLVFLAADRARLEELCQATRSCLAWKSIVEDRETLNLDSHQLRQAQSRREDAERAVRQRIPEAYQWALVPEQKGEAQELSWNAVRLSGDGPLAARVSKKLVDQQLLWRQFGATVLRLKLDEIPLWREDHVSIQQLAEDFAKYLYLPRLRSPELLLRSVELGLPMLSWEQDTFAYAESYDEEKKRYRGLKAGEPASAGMSGLLVKPEVARAQIEQEAKPGGPPPPGPGPGPGPEPPEPQPEPEGRLPTRFYATISLDPLRLGTQAGQISDEILAHLDSLAGAEVEVTLEIHVEVPDGVPEKERRIVNENCRTIGFDQHGFEEE